MRASLLLLAAALACTLACSPILSCQQIEALAQQNFPAQYVNDMVRINLTALSPRPTRRDRAARFNSRAFVFLFLLAPSVGSRRRHSNCCLRSFWLHLLCYLCLFSTSPRRTNTTVPRNGALYQLSIRSRSDLHRVLRVFVVPAGLQRHLLLRPVAN